MKYMPFLDRFMPKKYAYHLKIFISALLLTILTHSFWGGNYFTKGFWIFLAVTLIQMEIFIWMGTKFFKYIPGKTPKEITRNILLKLVLFYLSVLAIAVLIFFLIMTIEYIGRGVSIEEIWPNLSNQNFKTFFISANVGISLGVMLFFFLLWQQSLTQEFKLKEEKLIFQYETLKSQINPHFLFNSLNTLSSLMVGDTELADKFVNKLSSIYRYVLENTEKEYVELKAELEFVKDYFYLQNIRDEGKIFLDIQVEAPEDYLILPISLQMLLENAIKHNLTTRSNPLSISIFLSDHEHILVKNNVQRKKSVEKSSRIGLKNLNERIKLMMQKEVTINESDDSFEVIVPLKRK